jgi:eukaryotic-like serine/threonine-protein kinase
VRTGDVIGGRYRLEAWRGSGAGGVVWSAYDRKLKRVVALKRPHSVQSDAERVRFRREAQNAAQVQHPNVIAIYDTVDSADCWLVMEYLPSESLDRTLAERGPLPAHRVARIGLQIAAALAAAHARDVLHRDVKPGNVLVADQDLAKLTDFGISLWRAETLTDHGKVSGTAAYVAPEVANGRAATKASDVFSLAATLFAAVEGSPPFGTGDPDAVLARARASRIPEMHRAGSLAPVLSEMLMQRPGKRPTAEQVRQRLQEVVGTWEPPQSVPDPPKGRFRRRRVPWLVGAAVVAAAALLASSLLWTNRQPQVRPQGAASPDVIGNPTTADPCAITDQNALRRYGATTLNPNYGNFNRCDVLVDVTGDEQVDLDYELANADVPRVVQPDTFNVERHPLSDDSCDRRVFVSNEYDVWVTAKVDNPTVDLCAMADAATDGAVSRLRRGPLPRRRPFAPTSLATANACGLLDGRALAELPGVDATHPEVGFGNWECRWNSTIDSTMLHVLFDQSQPLTADDGTPIQLAGHAAFVQPDSFQDHSCEVQVVNRTFSDISGRPAVEVLIVVASGSGPGQRFCPMATDFARAAAANLPH